MLFFQYWRLSPGSHAYQTSALPWSCALLLSTANFAFSADVHLGQGYSDAHRAPVLMEFILSAALPIEVSAMVQISFLICAGL